VVALTFDAGANDAAVANILATLRATQTSATFFLTSRWTRIYPAEARLVASRYPVGNHTVRRTGNGTAAAGRGRRC
jgi:peptidoglycan-N-acetylglucosamine deacetylase